ncbi:hypothetical protein CDAR_401021 [Caerostris darwini]|uniref:Uncharacterized protein n=1 Tax=Caerostris darwini TaxID=1538125 RepID=A0AAV4TJ82_9ARAC|nr:hypothetical protein CDAR_401021 [Caerostris darwini]
MPCLQFPCSPMALSTKPITPSVGSTFSPVPQRITEESPSFDPTLQSSDSPLDLSIKKSITSVGSGFDGPNRRMNKRKNPSFHPIFGFSSSPLDLSTKKKIPAGGTAFNGPNPGLHKVYPDTGISSKAMSIMNSFVNDIFERIAAKSSRLAHYNNRQHHYQLGNSNCS